MRFSSFGAPHLSKDRFPKTRTIAFVPSNPDKPRTCPNHAHVKLFIIWRTKDFWCGDSQAREETRALLLLGTTAAGPLGSLDGLLVALGGTLHAGHEAGGGLEGPLEVAGGRVAEDVDLEQVALEG